MRKKEELVNYWLKQVSPDLIRYTTGILRDQERAKDVVQEAFMKLIEQDPAKIEQHLPQWLYRVCRNAAIDIWRRERKNDPFAENHEIVDSSNAEAHLTQEQGTSLLVEELNKMSPKHQEVLRLKFHDGLSYKEIAEVTGYTVTNVGFILHEAVQNLKNRVKKGGGL